jgi:hypothetical protein
VSECLSGARKENATYAAFSEKSVKVPGAYNCNGIYNFKGGCVMNVRAITRFLSASPSSAFAAFSRVGALHSPRQR